MSSVFGSGGLRFLSSPFVVMSGFFCRSALLLSLFIVAGGYGQSTYAQSSAVCDRALPVAEGHYREANYDEALRFVTACLDQNDRSSDQAVAAYRLLALTHLKRDELERARGAVLNLLGVDPAYTADPVTSPPSYVSLVAIVRGELEGAYGEIEVTASDRPSFFRRKSTWITAGSILVGSGVATYFTLGPGGQASEGGGTSTPGPGPLPIPPGTP